MKRAPNLALGVFAGVIVTTLLGVHAGAATPPPPVASAYAASASASASDRPDAVAVGSHRPWVPEPPASFPRERSPKPDKAAWKDAPASFEARINEPGCSLKRIREWVRLECEHLGIELVAGTREELDVGGIKDTLDQNRPNRVWAVFPARPGDRRYFELFTWSRWAPGRPDAVASVTWLEGESAPKITVEGLRWGI